MYKFTYLCVYLCVSVCIHIFEVFLFSTSALKSKVTLI